MGHDDAGFRIDESIGYVANRLARSFSGALTRRLAPHDVSVAQWAVLVVLWNADGLTQRALSRQVAIDEATMARTLDRMERDGLVRRQRGTKDRRTSNVLLSDRAIPLKTTLIPYAIEVNELAMEPLSATERDLVVHLMRRMQQALDSRSD